MECCVLGPHCMELWGCGHSSTATPEMGVVVAQRGVGTHRGVYPPPPHHQLLCEPGPNPPSFQPTLNFMVNNNAPFSPLIQEQISK